MALFATIIFAFSLVGIIVLFVLKAWETHRGYVLAPTLRTQADEQALRFKAYIMNGRQEAAKIIPFTTLMMRYFIHEGALAFARAAHFTGVQAHRLADFVSHKHHFERQAPRSEFLKRVAPHGHSHFSKTTPHSASALGFSKTEYRQENLGEYRQETLIDEISGRPSLVIDTDTATVSVEATVPPILEVTSETTSHTSVISPSIDSDPASETKPAKPPRQRKKRRVKVVAPSPHDDIDKHLYEGV